MTKNGEKRDPKIPEREWNLIDESRTRTQMQITEPRSAFKIFTPVMHLLL